MNWKKSDQKIKSLSTLVSDFLKLMKCIYSTSKQRSFFFFPILVSLNSIKIPQQIICKSTKKNEIKYAYESINVRTLFNIINWFLYKISFIKFRLFSRAIIRIWWFENFDQVKIIKLKWIRICNITSGNTERSFHSEQY